jgi:hypothetical protein
MGTDCVLCDVGTEILPTRNTHELMLQWAKLIYTSSMGTSLYGLRDVRIN